MDQISIQSSSSDNSSCSTVSYEGSDGYISDGEDPFFIPPETEENSEDEEFQTSVLSSSSSQDQEGEANDKEEGSQSSKSKDETQYEERRIRRQKKKQVKQIIDELKFGRNTQMLLNMNPLVPTYEEIQRIINTIKFKYPKRSIQLISQKLYLDLILIPKTLERQQLKIIPKPRVLTKSELSQKERLRQKSNIAAETFCQLGYGISKMRKYIEQYDLNVDIDIGTYDQIIKKLLLDAYHRLSRFLRKKCHKVIKPISSQMEEKFILMMLKDTKKNLDKFQIHNFYKLIKLSFTDKKIKISKRIASRLYHSTQEYIEKKKIKSGFINPDNPDCEIYNSDKLNWTDQMIDAAVRLYQKEGSLKRVKEIMSKDPYSYSQSLLDNRNIKYHIDNKILVALQSIKDLKSLLQKNPSSGMGIKDMIELDENKTKWVLNSEAAVNVRVILSQVYLTVNPTNMLINQAILAINQFILKKENELMLIDIKKTNRQYDPIQNQFRRRRRSKRR